MNVDRPARQLRLPWQKRKHLLPADDETFVSRRVPLLGRLPLPIKNYLVAMLSEFVGTFMFLLFAFGGTNVVNTAPKDQQPTNLQANPSKILFISLCIGLSVLRPSWIVYFLICE